MFLKNGAIYRINYVGWKTTPMPIIFVLYNGPIGNKIHGLYLNSNTNSRLEFVKFLAILRNLTQMGERAISNPRALYRTLKKYCPNFIRTSYRTLIKTQLTKFAIVSYGLTNEESYTELEKIKNDATLFRQGSSQMQTKILNTVINKKKVGSDFYTPNQKVEQKKTQQETQPSQNTNNVIQKNPGDQIEGYE
jgi:hypothetical protein